MAGKLGGEVGFYIDDSSKNPYASAFVETGLEIGAGYNLGEFNLKVPLKASITAEVNNGTFNFNLNSQLDQSQINYIAPYAYAYLNGILNYDVALGAFAFVKGEVFNPLP